jgi:glycosyltransferase involved in cell wall biosynthesis
MAHSRKLIVILGAHRSGTSLCAAAVKSLGADACLGEHYANEENQKGFFEHPEIVDFNNRLLEFLGGSWDNPLFDGAAYLVGRDLNQWKKDAAALIAALHGTAPVAVLKDPRMCQLLPFWVEVFSGAGYASENVYYIHTLRDVAEVSLSQKSRAQANTDFYEIGRSLDEAAALWLSLSAQAVSASRDLNVLYVSYAMLLAEPASVLDRIANFLGLSPDPKTVAEFCEQFVDRSLHRSTASASVIAELADSFPQVFELEEQLRFFLDPAIDGTEVADSCESVYRRADTQVRLRAIFTPTLSRLSNSIRADRLALAMSEEVAEDLRNQAQELTENTERMKLEHEQVVLPLRDEVLSLQTGTGELQSQLREQANELSRVSDIAEQNRESVVSLSQQKSELESFNRALTSERDSLEVERSDLEAQRDDYIEQVQQMENSTSWRITRPVRSLSLRIQRLRNSLASNWVQLRLKAILVYHRMSLRHPAIAWTIRRLVRPFFRFANRLFSVGPRDMHQSVSPDILQPMRYQQQEESENFAPLVSVIVPNYNHAAYLELRLESIFSQTYQNFEVILLDDASTDESAKVLRSFHQRYPGKATLVINEENSGGVFHQWERGLNLAKGDIVWIAESDDWCTENFLEVLVPYFENEAIMLAYARTVFMDGEGEQQIWSINEYLNDIDPQRWNHPILETGPAIVREAFAVKNIVPNVSSALFRTPRQLEILNDPEWREMKTCGDWLLYLHLLRGGMLAYSPVACNYYRIHGQNTSVESYSQDKFYREHELVARTVQQFYDVPDQVFETLRDNLEIHWRETRGEYSDEALDACFSLQRIRALKTTRAPNLLMASYAFCSGGGETFPVSLANIMKRHGYNVTYLDCAREPRLDGVRDRLRRDIPIVSDFAQLERIIGDFDVQVIHSHHAWMDSTILDILPEDMPCKTVVTLHGMYETINEYELKPILPRLVKRSAKLIYVAEKNLDAIRDHGLLEYARVERIDNALEQEAFEPISRASLGIADDAFVFTLVSRAMEEKGWREAIEAVTRAREVSASNIHLLLVGDGPEYDRMACLDGGLADFVHLEGYQRNVRGYFAVADMGFLPSKFRGESFPLVIIECLQSGIPLLASDLGEISRMLEGPKGMAGAVLSLDGDIIDIAALRDKIVSIVTDERVRQAMYDAVPEAAAKFDPAILADKHDIVYRAVLEVVA